MKHVLVALMALVANPALAMDFADVMKLQDKLMKQCSALGGFLQTEIQGDVNHPDIFCPDNSMDSSCSSAEHFRCSYQEGADTYQCARDNC